MSINLNRTSPAAPAGSTNIKFQSDVSGNVSGYVPTPAALLTASNVDSTGNTANIGSTTLLAVSTAGIYRISAYIIVTTVDGASSTLPKVTISWTDQDNSQTQSFDITPTNSGNLQTTLEEGSLIVDAAVANISYATSGYASGTPAIMTYALHLRIEQM